MIFRRRKKKNPDAIDKSKLRFGTPPKTARPHIPGMSKEHLDWIRLQACVVTRSIGASAHHLVRVPKHLGRRGMAMKELDIFAIPLIHNVHMDLHDGELDEPQFLLERAGIADTPRYALETYGLKSPDPEIRDFAQKLLKEMNNVK